MRTIRDTIERALAQYRGDNLERAESAFRNCTRTQMQEQYGQSGQTRQQIIDEYQTHVKEVETALKWLKEAL